MCDCLSRVPNWGPGPQPRHVPWLGIKPATLWFTGQCSIHWAPPARAINFFFKLHVPTSTSFQLVFSSASSPLSAFIELKKLRPCSGLSFGLRIYGWFNLLSRQLKFSLYQNKDVLLSYYPCVHWSSIFIFLQELSFCIHNLAANVWHKRPSF